MRLQKNKRGLSDGLISRKYPNPDALFKAQGAAKLMNLE